MLSSPHEYVAELERRGLMSARAPVPEHDTGVWNAFFALYETHVGNVRDIPIVLTPAGLGFYRDPLDDKGIYTWALTGPICHPILPLTPAQLVAGAGSILETFDRDGIAQPAIVTETFEMAAAPEPELAHHFLWLNSPRARVHDDFHGYASSLSSSRRHELRRLLDSFSEERGFSFEFTDRCPDTREIDFILANLHQRWGAEDMPYALVQSLWPIAVCIVMPQRARFMRVYYKGLLAFLNGFILRDQVIISQSTCKNVELSFNGLGTLIDFQAVQLLGKSPIRHLDPTCRTSVADPASIEIAKRKVVNEDARKPVFLAGYNLPVLEVSYPYLDPVRGWIIPDTQAIIGKPA